MLSQICNVESISKSLSSSPTRSACPTSTSESLSFFTIYGNPESSTEPTMKSAASLDLRSSNANGPSSCSISNHVAKSYCPTTESHDWSNSSTHVAAPRSGESSSSSDIATGWKWPPSPESGMSMSTFDSSTSRSPSASSSRSSFFDSEASRGSSYSAFSSTSSPSRTSSNAAVARSLSTFGPSRFVSLCAPAPPALTIVISDDDIVPTFSVDEALAEFRATGRDTPFDPVPQPTPVQSSGRRRSSRKKCRDPSCKKCSSKGGRKKGVRCVFCATNGEEEVEHMFKNAVGEVVCPVLSAFTCKLCGASGTNAHTFKYCPRNPFSRGNPAAAGLPPGLPFSLAEERPRHALGAS
ncbi:putative protein TPRXL [Penaeus japonicus]|uniref:putative protein TPRXL n=1 Tax=Penaeus japonicus TaxID=27405 RepID=UPI001C70CCF8|nr:putative protein TPRXL [Penaeus japonicus]